MRHLLATLLVGFIAIFSIAVQADASDHGRLTVSASASLPLAPDQAALNLGVSRRGDDVATLQAEVDRVMSDLNQYLLGLDIDSRHIASTQLRIQPIYRYDQKQQQRVSDGYEVTRSAQVMLNELDLLGRIMTDATGLGVNTVSPPQLSSSQQEAAYREALGAAIEQAKERAQVMASAAGAELEGIESIDMSGDSPSPMPVARMAMASDAENGGYSAGELNVTARVRITFKIDD